MGRAVLGSLGQSYFQNPFSGLSASCGGTSDGSRYPRIPESKEGFGPFYAGGGTVDLAGPFRFGVVGRIDIDS